MTSMLSGLCITRIFCLKVLYFLYSTFLLSSLNLEVSLKMLSHTELYDLRAYIKGLFLER